VAFGFLHRVYPLATIRASGLPELQVDIQC